MAWQLLESSLASAAPFYSRGLNYLSIHYRARACSGALGVIKYRKSRTGGFFSLTCEKAQQGSRGSPLFQCGFRPWNNGGTVTSGRDHEPWNYLDSKSMCCEYVVDTEATQLQPPLAAAAIVTADMKHLYSVSNSPSA